VDKLSIICPTYNRFHLLQECVAPLLSISSFPLEIVIVDDASTDDTYIYCDSLVQEHGPDKIRYIQLSHQSGAQHARNSGFAESSGSFVLFLDSDDIPLPEGVAALYGFLVDDQSLDFVYGVVSLVDINRSPLSPGSTVGARYSSSNSDIAGYHWHTMGAMYRRSLLDLVGPWNVSLTGCQDWEFQARVKLLASSHQFVDNFIGLWRQHSQFRVGTNSFRRDYVQSVILACSSILQHSQRCNRADKALRTRLAKRVFLHALEFGAYGIRADKLSSLKLMPVFAPSSFFLHALSLLFFVTPPVVDAYVYRLLRSSRV